MKWMGGWNLDDLMSMPTEYIHDIIEMINEEAAEIERNRT